MTRGMRVLDSLVATALGWCAGAVFAVLWLKSGHGSWYWPDVQLLLFLTDVLSGVGWLLAFLPLVLLSASGGATLGIVRFTLLAGLLALAGFRVLAASWIPAVRHPFYPAHRP